MSEEEETSPRNFLRKFRDEQSRQLLTLTAAQFMEIWNHYDADGNGYIEGSELDSFLREFVSSVNAPDVNPMKSCCGLEQSVPDAMLEQLKECFMEAYDDNQDGRIEIRELAQLLPMEENFLLLFRFDNPLESSVDFMRVWKQYDKDNSGFIEKDELKNFLRNLLKEAKKMAEVSDAKLQEYTDSILHVFDTDKDGKLQLSEMAKLLPVRENFFGQQKLKEILGTNGFGKEDIERIFEMYDRDKSGAIESDELRGLLKDLLDQAKKPYTADDLLELQQMIMRGCDVDHDGKINRRELTMILLALTKVHN